MNYRLSPAARADLRSIWTYTAEAWGSSQADHYILSIESACENLALERVRGRSADRYRRGYMSFAVGSHFVFYKALDRGSIAVIRILHQRMDIHSRLLDRPQ